MLEQVIANTNQFVQSVPKEQRKDYGQFFTAEQSAVYMATMFDFDLSKETISFLDAGAGTGLLAAAFVQRLLQLKYAGHIHLVCYENDSNVIPTLIQNLELIKQQADFSYIVKVENYITSQYFEQLLDQNKEQFDYIIGNPPYLKLPKDAPEARTMPQVCYGAPNLYFLFWAMGIYNLKQNGELVYIIPRSWTSGAYFKKFRQYLFQHANIQRMHLFVYREKLFNQDAILQETMIVKIKKSLQKPTNITISSSSSADFADIQTYQLPYDDIVDYNQFVYLVTNPHEADVLHKIQSLPYTLPQLNLQMKTGLVVDFRTQEVLRNTQEEGTYPLFYSCHIKEGKVIWPVGKQGEFILTQKTGLLQPNGNYLFVKRFTSKEEKRRLQCGMYRQKDYPQFQFISTQNKINYIACQSLCVLYGLYALLGSSLYDQYYRILNGSTQVNSTEVNQIPVPARHIIEAMGNELMKLSITEQNCNKIVEKWIN